MNGYTRRVFRWVVPVNDWAHKIGGGDVVMVDSRGTADVVEVWTIEVVNDKTLVSLHPERRAQVYGTGHPVPHDAEHVGSTLTPDGVLVWHVFREKP